MAEIPAFLTEKRDDAISIIDGIVKENNSVLLENAEKNDLKTKWIQLFDLEQDEFTAHQFIGKFTGKYEQRYNEWLCAYNKNDRGATAQVHKQIAEWLENVATHTRDTDSITVFGNIGKVSVWKKK